MKTYVCHRCGRKFEGRLDRCPHCGQLFVYLRGGSYFTADGRAVTLDKDLRHITKIAKKPDVK